MNSIIQGKDPFHSELRYLQFDENVFLDFTKYFF